MEFLRLINNVELRPDDVPAADATIEACDLFALTLDGYAVWGDDVARMAAGWAERWRVTGELPGTLTEVRGCLFAEQRRRHWASSDEVVDELPAYDAALLSQLRALLRAGAKDSERETVASWLAEHPGPGAWDRVELRMLIADSIAQATAAIDIAVGSRSAKWAREEDLRGGIVGALRRRGELVITEGRLGLPGWTPNLGGFDFAIVGQDGSVAVAETKWADGNLYECLWDFLKLASASMMPRVKLALAIYGAPVKHWHKPVPCADLFDASVVDTTKLLSRYPKQWQKNLDGSNAKPENLPLEFAVERIAEVRADVLGTAWEVRAVAIAGGQLLTWLEDGWPPGGPPTDS